MNPPLEASLDPRLRRLLEAFAYDPTDDAAFAVLEQGLGEAAAWSQLAGLYECRLAARTRPDLERPALLLRLARLLHERLAAIRDARRCYEELLRLDPRHAEGLAGLRRLLAGQGELAAALQIAELEEGLVRGAAESARLLSEIGVLWAQLGETVEARRRFEAALDLDPACDEALEALGALAEREGRREEALRLAERRLERLQGDARAALLERIAGLLPEGEHERARGLLREALRHSPGSAAFDKLVRLETARGAWERVDEVQRLRLTALQDPAERLSLALEAASLQLERASNLDASLFWVERAGECAPADPELDRLRARIHRRAGQTRALIEVLERIRAQEGQRADLLRELAVLYEREGEREPAVELARALLELEPDDVEALSLLDRCLARLSRHAERVEVLEARVQRASSEAERTRLLLELGDLCAGRLADPGAAEFAFGRARKAMPDDARAVERLALLWREQGRFAELERLLVERAARARGDAGAHAWCEVADVRLVGLGDAAGAREACLRAVAADPESAAAVAALRRVAEVSGVAVWRLEACELELERDVPVAQKVTLLAELVELAKASREPLRARQAAQRWAELAPDAAPLQALASVCRELGDTVCEQSALERLESLLRSQPAARAEALARLGDLALERVDPDALEKAVLWYRESLAAHAQPRVHAQLIDLHRRQGNTVDLIFELRRALEGAASREQIPLRLELARAQARQADPAGAVETLWPALAEDPANAQVGLLLERLLEGEGRLHDLADLIARRLARERDPAQRRALALRRAALLLDVFRRPADAANSLRELADPSRDGDVERLFERALEIGADHCELEVWLRQREVHLEGRARLEALQRLAALQQALGRLEAAIETLRRAERLAPPEQREALRGSLLVALRAHGSPRQQLELLAGMVEHADEPAARADLRVERARLLASVGGDGTALPQRALAELELAQEEAPLGVDGLRLLAALCARVGALERLPAALELLAGATPDAEERLSALLQLADLRAAGPESLREFGEAERALRLALELAPQRPEACDRLVSLYEGHGRSAELELLLEGQLRRDLQSEPRRALSMRLAKLQAASGRRKRAIATLEACRTAGASSPALEELLFANLEAQLDVHERIDFCREQAERSVGSARRHWLNRCLVALEVARESPQARLAVVDTLLAEGRDDVEILEIRAQLLRERGDAAALVTALEALVAVGQAGSPRRQLHLRELLGLLEDALAAPERALRLIESEVAIDPSLRERGVRLARKLADPARLVAMLSSLVLDPPPARPATPSEVRELALALLQLGRPTDAVPLLWRVLERQPRDRAALDALEQELRRSGARSDLLRVLEIRFPLDAVAARTALARESVGIADQLGDEAAELRWLRRWHALEALPWASHRRLAELERRIGDLGASVAALRALRERAPSPALRAELIAQEAELEQQRGNLELARVAYADAIAAGTSGREDIPLAWLQGLDRVLQSLGRDRERAPVLLALAEHPALDAAERARRHDARLALLVSQPELRAQAAAELRSRIEHAPASERGALVSRTRQLLRLYDELDLPAEWCSFAERLLPLVSPRERRELRRELARRATHALCARDSAIAHWHAVLLESPRDAEALETLSGLLRAPGLEGRLARVLEQRCALGDPGEAGLRVEAARVSWESLGDVRAALRHLDRALELDADAEGAHDLRSRLCERLDRPDEEAASLRALLDRSPSGALAARRWARLAGLLARRSDRLDQALRAAESALALGPGLASVRSAARRVFELAGMAERAGQLLRDEIREAPLEQCAALLRHLAWIEAVELRSPNGVVETLEALAEVTPLSPEDEGRLADSHFALGHFGEAIAHRRRGLENMGAAAGEQRWLELARCALEHGDDPSVAREACGYALLCSPGCAEALALRADLYAREGDAAREIADRQRLGELLPAGPAAAGELARAARIALERLHDHGRARGLFRAALRRDSGHVDSLVGAGHLAVAREDWDDAERMFGLACSALAGESDPEASGARAGAARLAARSALERERFAQAFRYYEIALADEPEHAPTLDGMASLALRLGALEQARLALEARLAQRDLAGGDRAERLQQLALVCESQGDLPRAALALDELIAADPVQPAPRERAVDLALRLGQTQRALTLLGDWIHEIPTDAPGLHLCCARLEARSGRRAEARQRLEALTLDPRCPAAAWSELAALVLQDDGPAPALEVAARAGSQIGMGSQERAALAWVEAQSLFALGRADEAARCASETLEYDPSNLEAARIVARSLSHVGDWRAAVSQLERAIELARPSAACESELQEAIGRAYAGPLEDMRGAERAYRRALECNPIRTSAREALADVTSFDPERHRESLGLHRELLEAFPGRIGSWRAIARIGAGAGSERVMSTCRTVLAALEGGGGSAGPAPSEGVLVNADPPADPAVRAATEVVRALEEEGALPRPLLESERRIPGLPFPIQSELVGLSGRSFALDNDTLTEIWRSATRGPVVGSASILERARGRVRRGLRGLAPMAIRQLDPEIWREELLARAAALAVRNGRLSLREALLSLLASSPSTAHLSLATGGDLAAATQMAPAARALLLRVADASIAELRL